MIDRKYIEKRARALWNERCYRGGVSVQCLTDFALQIAEEVREDYAKLLETRASALKGTKLRQIVIELKEAATAIRERGRKRGGLWTNL